MTITLDEALERATAAAQAGDLEGAWAALEPHRGELVRSKDLACAWLMLLALTGARDPGSSAHRERGSVLGELGEAWPGDPSFVHLLALAHLAPIDGRPVDDPVPEGDPSLEVIRIVKRCLDQLDQAKRSDPEIGGRLGITLAAALRLAGPRFDEETESVLASTIALAPERAAWLAELGLFYKSRGRWAEAVAQLEKVRELEGNQQPTLWNLAICATAAGDGDLAARAWRALRLDARQGADGLPIIPGLPRIRVRLSNARIGGAPSGGIVHEEVWVRPRSPCHGVVENLTRSELIADYGDVVLWDGAPIGSVKEGAGEVPIHPALARIAEGGVRKMPFVAGDLSPDRATDLNRQIPDAVWLHVFEPGPPARGVIVIEPESDPVEARSLLEPVLARAGVRLAMPELLAAAGDVEAARAHEELRAGLSDPRDA